MYLQDPQKRLLEANKLLVEDTTSAEKLESLRVILKGLNPKLDQALQNCAESFSKIEKLQSGDVISLSADSLPENSEEEKRRKKAIIAYVRTWEDLKSEVERVKSEFENSKNPTQQAQSAGRIITFAKGPFGLITLASVLIGGFLLIKNINQSSTAQNPLAPLPSADSSPSQNTKTKMIIFNGKKIPLSEVQIREGPDCDSPHYHALNHISVKALDGTTIKDPGACAFGKTKEVTIVDQ